MNRLVENFPTFSRFRNNCENIATFALSVVSKYEEAALTAIPCAILACLCVWICVKCLKSKRMNTSSGSSEELHGGDSALRRLYDYYEAEAHPDKFHRTDSMMKDLLDHEHIDLKKLQSTVGKVERSGTGASVIEELKKAEKAQSGNPHEAYEIGMLLVELLIYTGNYEEALKHECLTHEEISDARRPMYKAIIHIMKGDYEAAEKYWEEFNDMRKLFLHHHPSDQETDSTITDFHQFRNKVEKLRRDMQEISNKKARK